MGIKKIIGLAGNAFFPKKCIVCGKEGELLCQDCLSLVDIFDSQFCPFCKRPRKVYGKAGKCLEHRNKKLDGLFAATSYQDKVVNKAIKMFKYNPFLKGLAKPLAYLIVTHLSLTENKDILSRKKSVFTPIPLHPSRKRWRGFNQSEEIAKELSSFFNIPLTCALKKIKKGKNQVNLSAEERKKNVKDSFSLDRKEKIKEKTVFLVDDIFTTGATMEEAAKILKSAGAKEVWGIAIARE